MEDVISGVLLPSWGRIGRDWGHPLQKYCSKSPVSVCISQYNSLLLRQLLPVLLDFPNPGQYIEEGIGLSGWSSPFLRQVTGTQSWPQAFLSLKKHVVEVKRSPNRSPYFSRKGPAGDSWMSYPVWTKPELLILTKVLSQRLEISGSGILCVRWIPESSVSTHKIWCYLSWF